MNRRKEAPRIVDQPEPGWYRIRLAPKAPFVGARIIKHEDGRWQALVNGDPEDEGHADPFKAKRVIGIGNFGQKITEDEYFVLIGKIAYAIAHVPNAPESHPLDPIDLGALPPLF